MYPAMPENFMNEPRQCPQCGAALPGDVLEGLCPQCMARVVFGEDHAATGEPEGKAAATIRVDPDSDATIERPGTIIGRA